MSAQRQSLPAGATVAPQQGEPPRATVGFGAVMNHSRWLEVTRIVVVAVLVFAYAQRWVPIGVLWATVAVGLYPERSAGSGCAALDHRAESLCVARYTSQTSRHFGAICRVVTPGVLDYM